MDDHSTCLKVNKLLGIEPVEVIGTFVGGVLHGNAKFVLADGKVVIANFVNGLADGLRRDWDEKGALTSVSFSYHGAKVGNSWQVIGKSLVYADASTLKRSENLTIVIPLKNDSQNSKILAGIFWNHISVLDEVQHVRNLKSMMEEESCILRLFMESKGQTLNSFYDIAKDKFFDKLSNHGSAPECQGFESTDQSVPRKLQKWYQELSYGTGNKTFYQTALQMRQENEAPSSGTQLISEISFENADSKDDFAQSVSEISVTFFEQQRSKVHVALASFDEQLHFHGVVELRVVKSVDPKHNFGFDIKNVTALRGFFNHGILEGPALLKLLVITLINNDMFHK